MEIKERLYQYLLRQDKKSIYLKELKDDFAPIELASQLRTLECLGMVAIDWQRKVIRIKYNYKNVILKKDELTKYDRNTPDYMKSKTVGINEPYIG